MSYGKTDMEQAVINYRKIARAAIRLKHSIAADNELNDLMPALEAYLAQCAADGRIPALTVDDILQIAEGLE